MTWIKKLGIRWDCGDYMVAVKWYELEGGNGLGDDYSKGHPIVNIFNSSELRLAGFSMTQLSGERILNARARRGAQAEYQTELTAKEVRHLSSETKLIDEGGCRCPVYIKRRLCMFHIHYSMC
jgi:hypothetical protein